MPELNIKQEFGKTYIVTDFYQTEEEYLVRMITDNEIKGHLPCRVSYEGNRKKLMYEVTNMISLSSEFENKYIELDELRYIFEEIQNIYSIGNRHLLDEKYYYIDPMYMYRDIQDGELKLLYIPGINNTIQDRYHFLADFLLQRINRNSDSCVQIAYHFYRMSASNTFSISMFLNVIQKETIIRKKPEKRIEEKFIEEDLYSQEEEMEYGEEENVNLIIPIIFTFLSIVMLSVYFIYFKNTIYSIYCLSGIIISGLITMITWGKKVYEIIIIHNEEDIIIPRTPVKVEEYWGDEETVVLQDNSANTYEEKEEGCRLEWKEGGVSKSFLLKTFPVVIGKMRDEVDCFIEDASISRIHAKIVNRNHEWFIFDLNSTNGSSVDGEKLLPGQEKRIYQDSEILLGNVSLRVVV